MGFKKYQHVERFGTDEVDGIELGVTHIFPKLDGTNASLWISHWSNGIKAGSRNRELTLENDNAGFYNWALEQERFEKFFQDNPVLRLYGEWLVPHSLKTYIEKAWRNFYVFDVMNGSDEYLTYEQYKPLLEAYNIDYIPPIAIVKNGSYEQFVKCLEKNVFLIEDGKGAGEGIVIKNYGFYNKYKRQTWAKIVTNEFKEKHHKEMGAPVVTGEKMIEERIVEEYCTNSLIEKEYSKILVEKEGWKSQYIPMLLGKVFYELINEEMWNIVKQFKNPKINFKTLNALVISKIKECKNELF